MVDLRISVAVVFQNVDEQIKAPRASLPRTRQSSSLESPGFRVAPAFAGVARNDIFQFQYIGFVSNRFGLAISDYGLFPLAHQPGAFEE